MKITFEITNAQHRDIKKIQRAYDLTLEAVIYAFVRSGIEQTLKDIEESD